MIKLMLLTADTSFAQEAQSAGVDRIFFDLEYINKVERQMGRSTVISVNNIEDIAKIRKVIDTTELLVRVNPINPGTPYEINKVIRDGADIVMLPMVLDAEDAEIFVSTVAGRAKVCLLLETSQALVRLDDILAVPGVDEIYIGLNDLHISMNLKFMFELLSGGIIDYMAEKIKAKGMLFGFGGIAKIGEGMLPAENIIGEHYRMGSSSVILSRTFRNEIGDKAEKIDLKKEIQKIRDRETEVSIWTEEQFLENKKYVKQCVDKIARK